MSGARSKRRAITLVEILIVLSIIAVLSAIAYPVIVRAKRSARITRSVSNMRQIHAALMVYVSDMDDGGPVGLGLPPSLLRLRKAGGLPVALFRTGGTAFFGHSGEDVYTWMPPHVGPGIETALDPWKSHVQRTQENPIIVVDETQNSRADFALRVFDPRFAVGIYYQGNVRRLTTRGPIARYEVWER